jgi:hypothetical protein
LAVAAFGVLYIEEERCSIKLKLLYSHI